MLQLFHLLQQLYSHIQLEKHDHLVKIVMHLNHTNKKKFLNKTIQMIKHTPEPIDDII
jgi:hypothetical protein